MNTRKDNNGKAIAAWKALGLAKIQKPLRYIKNKCARVYTDSKGNATTEYVQPYPIAEAQAARGNGKHVHQIALHIANS